MPTSPPPRPAQLRLFSPAGIAIGTLLGSFVAGVAMIWFNYKVMGYPSLGNRIAGAGMIFYIMIITAASMAPNSPAVGVTVMLGQCALAWWAATALQGDAIGYYLAKGGTVYGLGPAALVGLATGLVAVAILMLIGRITGMPIGLS